MKNDYTLDTAWADAKDDMKLGIGIGMMPKEVTAARAWVHKYGMPNAGVLVAFLIRELNIAQTPEPK